MKVDDPAKNQCARHPGESRGPDVVPTKVGDHPKDWIPAFAGMTYFAGQNFSKKIIYFSICNLQFILALVSKG
jgi:hypothetical protein